MILANHWSKQSKPILDHFGAQWSKEFMPTVPSQWQHRPRWAKMGQVALCMMASPRSSRETFHSTELCLSVNMRTSAKLRGGLTQNQGIWANNDEGYIMIYRIYQTHNRSVSWWSQVLQPCQVLFRKSMLDGLSCSSKTSVVLQFEE